MSGRARILAALLAIPLLAGACKGPPEDTPVVVRPSPSPEPEPETCPLTGLEPPDPSALERPAVAVKVENSPVAYPLSGLERAEVVYEELVEGGITRFLAIYHCTDARTVGPVRSSRFVDPAIMIPTTRILAAAGGNRFVRDQLDKFEIVLIDEDVAGDAMRRMSRPGITFEHTLYGHTAKLRALGAELFRKPPAKTFEFGELEGDHKRARRVDISFSGFARIRYVWNGNKWIRSDRGTPLEMSSGERIAVDNVLIEEHELAYSRQLVDVRGSASVQFEDRSGAGRAVLFRNGRAIKGRWVRASVDEPVRFETRSGEAMVFAPGTIWIELVPTPDGEVRGSFSFSRKRN